VRVLLVSMPFGSLEEPSPAISLLKSRLLDLRVECHVLYATAAFARAISTSDYSRIADRLPEGTWAGEWVFARCVFGPDEERDERYLEDVARRLSSEDRRVLLAARDAAAPFLAELHSGHAWDEFDVIGFTSSCAQNLASLALARSIKESHPSTTVMFGGANWEGEMGVALLESFPWVDIAFLGEADDALPSVLWALSGIGGVQAPTLEDVPGIAYRAETGVQATEDARPICELDRLPPPDFRDFFTALSHLDDAPHPDTAHLWLQASRGCYWAAREPCRFCGLNGTKHTYRTKSADRILREIRDTAAAWPGSQLNLSDTVVPRHFLDMVIPALAEEGIGLTMWFEVRPELTREQVKAIAAAGGEVQIGIESLSDHVLDLMGKGSRALEGLRLLKWCEMEGLSYCWNLIYDIPGETDQDYEDTIAMLPALRALMPPRRCGPMILERFSPYHARAGACGIVGVRPPDALRFIYALDEEVLERITYMFEHDRERGLVRSSLIRRLHQDVAAWKECAGEVQLHFAAASSAWIDERRAGSLRRSLELDDLDALLYAACEDIGEEDDLVRLAGSRLGADGLSGEKDLARQVKVRLERFVDEEVMVTSGGRYLSTALPVCRAGSRAASTGG
jgi:ribosomal peptide maturation radical SAM protein 1